MFRLFKRKPQPAPDVEKLQATVDALTRVVEKYSLALGPVWRTAEGHTACLATMSDNHLENILEGGFGSQDFRAAICAELDKRRSDDEWHGRKGKLSARQALVMLNHLANVTGLSVEVRS